MPGPARVDDAADERAEDGREQEAGRERAGREAAVPFELVDQGGSSSENAVRPVTPIAIVTKAIATISQP